MNNMQAGLPPERTALEIYEDHYERLVAVCQNFLHIHEAGHGIPNIMAIEYYADRTQSWSGKRYLDEDEDPKPTYQEWNEADQ